LIASTTGGAVVELGRIFEPTGPGDATRDAPVRVRGRSAVDSLLLSLQASAGNRAVAELLASNPATRPALSVQKKCVFGHAGPAKKHGVSMNAVSKPWGSTGMQTELVLSYQGVEGAESTMLLCRTTSNQSVTHGAEHAEDVALRTIRGNLGLFKPAPAVNRLWMSITKSPCTSIIRNGLPATSTKAVGCTEELINFVTNGLTHPISGTQYNFSLTVHVYGLYAPQVPGYTQAEVLDASQGALNALAATNGIQVTGDVRIGSASRFEAQ
jgi:hypothetical protein